jgi:hypothetical protein
MATLDQRQRKIAALLSQKSGFNHIEDGDTLIVDMDAVKGVDRVAEAHDIVATLQRDCLQPTKPIHVQFTPEPA